MVNYFLCRKDGVWEGLNEIHALTVLILDKQRRIDQMVGLENGKNSFVIKRLNEPICETKTPVAEIANRDKALPVRTAARSSKREAVQP